ncbi:receptor like protein 29-like [Nymphaea colorata]|uniref:receptor like protein 29-like n=1 Tax=Nymphaea colorata TaxID=210225 RepID=UPI00129E350A|nr:receptor like protein 29-like [Nymphaea colorata]
MTGLVGLDLAYTGLVGTFPASMPRLRNLTYLSLDHNGLTGAIPSGLGGLPFIHDLDLSYNQLSGQVPFQKEVVERLGPKLKLARNNGLCLGSEMVGTSLVRVEVDGFISANLAESLACDGSAVGVSRQSVSKSLNVNQKWSHIVARNGRFEPRDNPALLAVKKAPSEVWGFLVVAAITVSGIFARAAAAGDQPPGELKGLEMLVLCNNSINGTLPLFLGRMQGLQDLHLGGNPLGGTLPDVWSQMTGLVGLDLAYTGLVGTFPASMPRLCNLTYLSLDHNGLTGAIPSGLGGLPFIHDLDLSYNQLSGQVPFRKEVVERLGPKLKLARNNGLCLGSEKVRTGLVREEVDGFISANLAESLACDGSAVSSSGSSFGSDSWYRMALALLPAACLPPHV